MNRNLETNVRNGGGALLTKRGFTLIELLAVIIILAIIALIATPIVLNIIKESKISSSERSAENYINAVEQAIAKKKMADTTFNPSSCIISMDNEQSKLVCDSEEVKVDINGEYPTEGTIVFSSGKIEEVNNLKLGGYFINKKNNKLVATTTKVEAVVPICTPLTSDQLTYTYVYYEESSSSFKTSTENYITGNLEIGNAFNCRVNDSTSYIFVIIGNDSNGNYNLLLNHNLSILDTSASSMEEVYNLLKDNTKTWNNITKRTDSFNGSYIDYTNGLEEEIPYSLNYSGLYARYIHVEEISNIESYKWVSSILSTTPTDYNTLFNSFTFNSDNILAFDSNAGVSGDSLSCDVMSCQMDFRYLRPVITVSREQISSKNS